MESATHFKSLSREALHILRTNPLARSNYRAVEDLSHLAKELKNINPHAAEVVDPLIEYARVYYGQADHPNHDHLYDQMLTQAKMLAQIADEMTPDANWR